MNIRPATAADLDVILELERSTPTAAHWSQAQYDAILNAPHATERLVLIADDESGPSGFLVARSATDEWEIENVVVAESARRRGLGRKLVETLLDAARRRGARALFLEVRESNFAACALYGSCGFKQSGRRIGYYSCPTEDAILYALAFSSTCVPPPR